MFNSINIGIDGVEFEYIEGGRLYCVNVGKPDGVSYSQWEGAWLGFKELAESGFPTLRDYVERQVDTSEVENLEDTIDELRQELDAKNSEIAGLEEEIERLEAVVDAFHEAG